MPPKQKKAPELIKGQSSLAGFFSNGRLSAVEQPAAAAGSRASGSSSASPAKSKSASPKKPKAPAAPVPPVEQLTEKITVAGYRPSASASPSPNKKTAAAAASASSSAAAKKPAPAPPADEPASDEEMAPPPAKSVKPSKYFAEAEAGSGKSSGKNAANAIDVDDSEDDIPVAHAKRAAPKSSSASSKAAPKRKKAVSDSDSSDFEPAKPVSKTRKTSATSTPTKARGGKSAAATASKSKAQPIELSDDDDDDYGGSSKPKPAASKKAKKEQDEDGEGGTEKKIPAFLAAKLRREQGPQAPGSKEIPHGKPKCLAGLTLVFTGELSSLSREDAMDLAKRYGARTTSGPSSKTSYVVLGAEPGPSKLAAIKKNGLKTLDEDGFLALIAARGESKPDPSVIKKQEAEVAKYKKAAADMLPKATKDAPAVDYSSALWTVKYAPRQLKDLVGNTAQIAKMQDWLENWDRSLASGFKKPGKHGIGVHRALLISGPPGIGKTSAAHLVAKLAGFNPIELNASDTRSKKLIESSLKETINNTSLDGWYNGGKSGMSSDSIRITDRTCLIMDEVDGMSGGDRGGVGAINVLIRKTKVPIICICNEAKSPKMKPLESTCAQLKFTRPDARTIRARMMSVAFREKMKISTEAMDELVQAAQSDIRLVINMLSTWNLSKKTMDFDEGKEMGAANMKPGMHTPFSLYNALSAPGMFSPTNKLTLNEKSEYYFNDHSIMPLMVQTNYISQRPVLATRCSSAKEQAWMTMNLMAKAAVSISDGDMIDSMIHGSQQQWSLMPLHAIASCVRPMSHVFGQSSREHSYGPGFPTWLGMNSKQQRLSRAAVELQARMRLAASGSRFEVREQYLPYFTQRLTAPLRQNAQAGIPEVISFMDDYYLGLEDRDNILELGVGANAQDNVLKGIASATKSSFTRQYNASDHPIAFYKGDASAGKIKKLKGEPAPDVLELEGAESDGAGADISDAESISDGELDLKKDKMVKAKKPSAKGKGKAKGK